MFENKTSLAAIRNKIAKIQADAFDTQECHVEYSAYNKVCVGGAQNYACHEPTIKVDEYLEGEDRWMRHCNALIAEILTFPENFTEAFKDGDDRFNVLVYEFWQHMMPDHHAYSLVCGEELHSMMMMVEIRNRTTDEIIDNNITDSHAHFYMFGFRNRAEMMQFDLTFRGLSTNEIFLRAGAA